jgi:hypothetical protein
LEINNSKEGDRPSDTFVLTNMDEIIKESNNVEINIILETLIFIAGYVSYKVSTICKCKSCTNLLISNKNLSWDIGYSTDVLAYMENFNRGGLKYPTKLSTQIAERAYKIFTVCTSQTYENMFLNDVPRQKAVLTTLMLEMLRNDDILDQAPCKCGRSIKILSMKCISMWTNILLNNYSKIRTNNIEKPCKSNKNYRKLTTNNK